MLLTLMERAGETPVHYPGTPLSSPGLILGRDDLPGLLEEFWRGELNAGDLNRLLNPGGLSPKSQDAAS